VTLSDLQRCRVLRLLDASDDSDEALQRAYEDRILVLRDMARPGVGPINPPIQALAARRRRWEATLDPTQSIPDLLARAGMTPAALEAWLADDVRIAMYLDQRFGAVAGADRGGVIRQFHQRLRRGAGLP